MALRANESLSGEKNAHDISIICLNNTLKVVTVENFLDLEKGINNQIQESEHLLLDSVQIRTHNTYLKSTT